MSAGMQRPTRPAGRSRSARRRRDGGTNFAVASKSPRACELCLFDDAGDGDAAPAAWTTTRGVWHGFVPGVGPGQAYGLPGHGALRPGRGLRCNPAKLLLDPYARAIPGEVSFGPEVLGYDPDRPDAASTLDSAAHVPRSLVVDPAFDWGPTAPPGGASPTRVDLRGARQGLHHAPPRRAAGAAGHLRRAGARGRHRHLVDLGVTAVELLPVHQ